MTYGKQIKQIQITNNLKLPGYPIFYNESVKPAAGLFLKQVSKRMSLDLKAS